MIEDAMLLAEAGRLRAALNELNKRLAEAAHTRGDGGTRALFISDNAISETATKAVRTARPALPDPRLVRRIIRNCKARGRHFDERLFADPAWDMLLDLAAARAEHSRVSVTSLCIASAVPPTTALRWIGQMVDQGLFKRTGDLSDRRRAFIELSDRAADDMARYFSETAEDSYSTVYR